MKTTIYMLILVLFTGACRETAKTNKANLIPDNEREIVDTTNLPKNPWRTDEKITLGQLYTDTVQFVEFNDEGDNWLAIVAKHNDTTSFIYDSEYNFVRGDEIEIRWKVDSIRYAGDSEFLDFTEFLISAKKLKPLQLQNKEIKFLWRETIYDKQLEAEINTIVLNEEYIRNITEPEKAVLAYIATFIGNACEWDGRANNDRSNLKCKILWALDLGYQCSHKHLDFRRFWFRNEEEIKKELMNCPTTPDGATVQDTFDEINLAVDENRIAVSFKVSGFNLRENKSWRWAETQEFEFKESALWLLKKERSPKRYEAFEVRGH